MNYQQMQYRFGNGTNISNRKVVCVEPKVLNDHQYRNGTSRNFRKHSCETAEIPNEKQAWKSNSSNESLVSGKKKSLQRTSFKMLKSAPCVHDFTLRDFSPRLFENSCLYAFSISSSHFLCKMYKILPVHVSSHKKNKLRIIFDFHFSCNRPVGIPCNIM